MTTKTTDKTHRLSFEVAATGEVLDSLDLRLTHDEVREMLKWIQSQDFGDRPGLRDLCQCERCLTLANGAEMVEWDLDFYCPDCAPAEAKA